MKRALVLSGGGMFGAWQAGAWRALADRVQPDLVVGASVGSLNGYAIAGGATPDHLIDFWRRPEIGVLKQLPATIQTMMAHFKPRTDFAIVATDLLRMKPRIFFQDGRNGQNGEITWKHLAASCALPGYLRQHRIDGRWYSDGGLLNALPVYAAVELGATHIVALHPLWPRPVLMEPFVRGFVRWFGHYPPTPSGIEIVNIRSDAPLGSMRQAMRWRREDIERWIELGYQAALLHKPALDQIRTS